MVSAGTARRLGWIYAVISLILAVLECALCVLQIVHEFNSFTLFTTAVAVVWLIFSIIFIVGIRKRNAEYVKAYRVFLFIGNAIMLSVLVSTNGNGLITEWNQQMLVSLFVGYLIVIVLFSLELWIVNGVIRYIENKREVVV